MVLSPDTVRTAQSEGWLSSLEMYCIIKCNKNILYNWTIEDLCRLTHKKKSSIYKHLKALKQKGLVEQQGRHLIFKRVKSKYVYHRKMNQEIRAFLYSLLIEDNYRKQKYRIERPLRKEKLHKTRLKKSAKENRPVLSVDGFSEVMGVSISTASRYKRKMKNLRLIRCPKNLELVAENIPYSIYVKVRENRHKYYQGKVYKVNADFLVLGCNSRCSKNGN